MARDRRGDTRSGLELAATLDGPPAALGGPRVDRAADSRRALGVPSGESPAGQAEGRADETADGRPDGRRPDGLADVLGATLEPSPSLALAVAGDESRVQVADPNQERLPARIGRYLVLRQLGRGGMGVVYSAYDPDLDRKVAVKVVRDGTKNRSHGRSRVQQEAQAMARVSHPNVVHVYEVGEDHESQGGRIFLAMELVPGQSLHSWQDQHPLRDLQSFDRRLRVYLQAAAGLAAAHDCGLIHRDFKPDNVLVGDDGRARVLDFGLARALAQPSSVDGQPASSISLGGASQEVPGVSRERLTLAGSIMGTPGYMAPEQVDGGEADARSDQFSFCAALYEALYGALPFPSDTFEEFAERVRRAQLPQVLPRALGGIEVPTLVEVALRRGLSRDPAARFPSMHALMAELERGLLPDADSENTRRIKRRSVLVVIALLVGVIVARRIAIHFFSGTDLRGAVLMPWAVVLAFLGGIATGRSLIRRQPRYRQLVWFGGSLLVFMALARTLAYRMGLSPQQYMPFEILGVAALVAYDIPNAGRQQVWTLWVCFVALLCEFYIPKYRIISVNLMYFLIAYLSGYRRLNHWQVDRK